MKNLRRCTPYCFSYCYGCVILNRIEIFDHKQYLNEAEWTIYRLQLKTFSGYFAEIYQEDLFFSQLYLMQMWDDVRNLSPSNARFFFFESNAFISNSRLKLAKNQANARQHPEVELYLKIIHILHPYYHLKIIGHILKNKQKNKCFYIHEIIGLITIVL